MKTIPGVGLQGEDNALQEAADLGFRWFQLLEPEGVQGGDIGRVLRTVPDAMFDVRFYSPNRMSQPAAQVAYNDYHRMMQNTTATEREHIRSVRPGNEMNLDVEHQGDVPWPGYWKSVGGYRRIDIWLVIYADAWRIEAANHGWKPLLMWPPLSPGNNPPGTDPESEYELLRDSMAAYDIIGINVYGPLDDEWTGSRRLGRIVSKLESLGLGGKPRVVTEVNKVNLADFCRYASSLGIEACFWFLWRSAGDDHRILDLYNPTANPKIGDRWIQGLAEYMAEPTPSPPAPGPSPTPPAPATTLAQLAHKIWDDGCRWQGKPWVEGFNPNIATHAHIEVRPQLGAMLTAEYPMEGFRLVKCAMALVIYDPSTSRTDAADCEAALKLILARWGYPKG